VVIKEEEKPEVLAEESKPEDAKQEDVELDDSEVIGEEKEES
jgi:hypothetical protein